jgi:hypothetical protein
VHLRASANGSLFGAWNTAVTPSGTASFVYTDALTRTFYSHSSPGYILPSPDGKTLFTRLGQQSPQLPMVFPQPPPGNPVIPAHHGNYYLSLPMPGKDGAPEIRAVARDKPVAVLGDLDVPTWAGEEWIKHDFTFDKRIHIIPEAGLVITIPTENDRLVLHRFKE